MVRSGAYGFDTEPMPLLSLIAKEKWRTVEHTNQQVFPAVIEEVGSSRAPGHITASQRRSGGHADLLKFPALEIVE